MEIGVKKLGPFLGPQFCSRAPDYIKMDQKCPQIEGFINAGVSLIQQTTMSRSAQFVFFQINQLIIF